MSLKNSRLYVYPEIIGSAYPAIWQTTLESSLQKYTRTNQEVLNYDK